MIDDADTASSGFTIPEHLGPTDAETDSINKKWQTYTLVALRLQQYGLTEPGIPDVPCPTISPADLRDPDGRGAVTAAALLPWLRYYGRWIARCKSKLLELANERTDIATTIRERERIRGADKAKPDRPTVDALKDITWQSKRNQQLILEEQGVVQEKLAVDAEYEYVERALKMLTRQSDSHPHHQGQLPQRQPPPPLPPSGNTPEPAPQNQAANARAAAKATGPRRKSPQHDSLDTPWAPPVNKPRLRHRTREQAHPQQGGGEVQEGDGEHTLSPVPVGDAGVQAARTDDGAGTLSLPLSHQRGVAKDGRKSV